MSEIEPGWNEALRIAWLLFWRGLAGGMAIGFALGLCINLALAYGFHVVLGSSLNAAMGAIVMLLWWPVVVRMALRKRYRDFRIALVPRAAP
jgi:hypothetical protein